MQATSRERAIAALTGLKLAEASFTVASAAYIAANQRYCDALQLLHRARDKAAAVARELLASGTDANSAIVDRFDSDSKAAVNEYLDKIGIGKI